MAVGIRAAEVSSKTVVAETTSVAISSGSATKVARDLTTTSTMVVEVEIASVRTIPVVIGTTTTGETFKGFFPGKVGDLVALGVAIETLYYI